MFKRFFAILVVVIMNLNMVQPVFAVEDGYFSDLYSDHPNYNAIQELARLGFVEGYPDGTFRPSRIINRAEATAMITRALGAAPDPGKYRNCFDDVRDEWFSKYVCYGKSERSRWLSGYPDTQEFRPEIHIIVVEAVRMAVDAFDIQRIAAIPFLKHKWDVPYGYKNRPQDFTSIQWYEDYLVTAREFELLDITPLANKLITRAEMAELIYRAWRFSELGPSGIIKEGGLEESSMAPTDTTQLQTSVLTAPGAGTCRLAITRPAHIASFNPAPHCDYSNSANADETQIWLGEALVDGVWGAPLNFHYTDPQWAMALAYAAEKFDVNPNYLTAVALKESRGNCSYADGCFQIGESGWLEVKQRFPQYFDASDTHNLVQPFESGSIIASLYLNFAETLWNEMYDWQSFWQGAVDPEARTKILTRGYNRGLWEAQIGTMLTEQRSTCQEAADVINVCFPHSSAGINADTTDPNWLAYDHAQAVVNYCHALSQTPTVYDEQLTAEDVQDFIDNTLKKTVASTQSVDWDALNQKVDDVFACLQDENSTISFRYDFKTLLQQITPLLP